MSTSSSLSFSSSTTTNFESFSFSANTEESQGQNQSASGTQSVNSFSFGNSQTEGSQEEVTSETNTPNFSFSFGNSQTDGSQGEVTSEADTPNFSFSLGNKNNTLNRRIMRASRRTQKPLINSENETLQKDFQQLYTSTANFQTSNNSQNNQNNQSVSFSTTASFQIPLEEASITDSEESERKSFASISQTSSQNSSSSANSEKIEEARKKQMSQAIDQRQHLTTTQTSSKAFTFSDADEKELKASAAKFNVTVLEQHAKKGKYKEALTTILLIEDLDTKVDLLKKFIDYAACKDIFYPKNFVLAARAQAYIRYLTNFIGDNTFSWDYYRSQADVERLWYSFMAVVMRNKDIDYDKHYVNGERNPYQVEVFILAEMVDLMSNLLNDYQYDHLATRLAGYPKKDPSRLTKIDNIILDTYVLRPTSFFYRDAHNFYPEWLKTFEQFYNTIKDNPSYADISLIDSLKPTSFSSSKR